MDVGLLLLVVGAVLLAGVAAALVAKRVGVPVLVAFLALGMLLGSEGFGGVEFTDAHLAKEAGIVGLAIILFEGGLATPSRAVRSVAVPAALLSTVGVAVTAAIAAGAAYLVFDLSLLAAFLLGAVVASTDAAAVFATLRFTPLRRRLAHLLETESGLNDPMAVALTVGLIAWIEKPGDGPANLFLLLIRQLGLGLAVGVGIGFLGSKALARLPAAIVPFAPVATLATGAVAFGATDVAGGSGFLAVFIVGLYLGNTTTPLRRSLIAFHQGLAFLAQIALFVVLGLFVFPSRLDDVLLSGLALAAVVILIARPAAVLVSTAALGFDPREKALLGWAGLRGAVPIVLATFPEAAGVPGSDTIFDAVFFVVVFSTIVQGPTLAPLARRLGVVETGLPAYEPPLDAAAVEHLGGTVVEVTVNTGAPVVGRRLSDIELPGDAVISMLVRDGQTIAAHATTTVAAADRLYILATPHSRKRVQDIIHHWNMD